MKGQLTSVILKEKIPMSMVYRFMDSLITESEEIFKDYYHGFNNQGEFVYRATNGLENFNSKFKKIEMIINDNGVFVNGDKHEEFTLKYLDLLEKFSNEKVLGC